MKFWSAAVLEQKFREIATRSYQVIIEITNYVIIAKSACITVLVNSNQFHGKYGLESHKMTMNSRKLSNFTS